MLHLLGLHWSTAAMAAGNNCESGSDGAAVNWFLIISRNSLESHEFLECHLSVIWWFVESSWCWSVVGLSALTLLICVDAVRNQNDEKYNYFQPSYRCTLGTLRPERSETAATAAHCAVQLQRARQLCSGGIVWLHDKISRITIWGQSCTSPAQPSPVSRPSGEQRAALLLYLEVSLMATSSCYFYNSFHFYIFRPSCDELMSGCFSFLITSDWIVKVRGVVSECREL